MYYKESSDAERSTIIIIFVTFSGYIGIVKGYCGEDIAVYADILTPLYMYLHVFLLTLTCIFN